VEKRLRTFSRSFLQQSQVRGLPGAWWKQILEMVRRLPTAHACHRRTDRQTDGQRDGQMISTDKTETIQTNQ